MRETPSFSEHDAELNLWLASPTDPDVKATRDALLRHLRRRGFKVQLDQRIKKQYPILSKDHHEGRKGDLQFKMAIGGRHLEIRFFQSLVFENKNGAEYDFNRRQKMPYLIGKQYELERNKIAEIMAKRGYTLELQQKPTGMAFIERRRSDLNSFQGGKFYDKPPQSYNSRTRGSRHVKDGDAVYFRHYDGRFRVGTAYHNINNMWWILAGKEAYNKASHELYFWDEIGVLSGRHFEPAVIERSIRNSLKRAVQQEAFERAAVLRNLIQARYPEKQAA